ncbi:MAG: response regulator transcription factor, partial [Rhizobiaceae bacterium]
VIVSSYGDVPIVVEAMRNGAFDFIEKPVDVNALLKTLALAKKQINLELGQGVPAAETSRRLALLTDREREVMDHLILGKTNKRIADELSISRRTVEVHRARLQNKMDARNLADLIQFAR